KTIATPGNPTNIEPGQVSEEPKTSVATEPTAVELFANAPRFLKLPPLASSAPVTWFSLTREPLESLTLVLSTDATTLPAGVSFRIAADTDANAWIIEQVAEGSGANQNVAIGKIRLNGTELSFACSA